MGFYMNQGEDIQEWVTKKIRALSDRCAYTCISIEKMPITVHFKGYQEDNKTII